MFLVFGAGFLQLGGRGSDPRWSPRKGNEAAPSILYIPVAVLRPIRALPPARGANKERQVRPEETRRAENSYE